MCYIKIYRNFKILEFQPLQEAYFKFQIKNTIKVKCEKIIYVKVIFLKYLLTHKMYLISRTDG